MRQWLAGYMLLIAAGIAILVSVFLPWGTLESPASNFYAIELGLWGPAVTAAVTGVVLIAFGAMRTMWAGLVGLVAVFVVTILLLSIHSEMYQAIQGVVPGIALGETTHVTGYGFSVLFVAGALAGFAGITIAVQTAPKVVK